MCHLLYVKANVLLDVTNVYGYPHVRNDAGVQKQCANNNVFMALYGVKFTGAEVD